MEMEKKNEKTHHLPYLMCGSNNIRLRLQGR